MDKQNRRVAGSVFDVYCSNTVEIESVSLAPVHFLVQATLLAVSGRSGRTPVMLQ